MNKSAELELLKTIAHSLEITLNLIALLDTTEEATKKHVEAISTPLQQATKAANNLIRRKEGTL